MGGILWKSMLAIVWWMVPTRLLSYGRQSLEPSRRGKKSPIKSRTTGAVHPSGMIFFVSTMEKLANNILRKQGIFSAPGQQRHRLTCLDSSSPSLQSVSTALKTDTWHHNAHSKSKEGHLCPQLPLQKKSLTKSLHKDSTEMELSPSTSQWADLQKIKIDNHVLAQLVEDVKAIVRAGKSENTNK